jgi:hypothetical protein
MKENFNVSRPNGCRYRKPSIHLSVRHGLSSGIPAEYMFRAVAELSFCASRAAGMPVPRV